MKKFTEWIGDLRDKLKEHKLFGRDLLDLGAKTGMALMLIIFIVSMMPSERPFEYRNLTVGSIAQEEIIAPFTFPIIKSDRVLDRERREAWLSVPQVFTRDKEPKNVEIIKLNSLFTELESFFKNRGKQNPKKKDTEEQSTELHFADSLLAQLAVKYNFNLNADQLTLLFESYKKSAFQILRQKLQDGLSAIYQQGVINVSKSELEEKRLIILENGLEEEVELSQVLDLNDARTVLSDYLRVQYPEGGSEFQMAIVVGNSFLVPNLTRDRDITRNRKDKAIREVPSTSGFVHENQRIIDSHEIVTEDVYQKLQSLASALAERSSGRSGWYRFLFYIGKYIFAVIIVLMIGFYLYYYRPNLFSQNKMLLLITTVFVFQFLTVVLILDVLNWSYLSIPVTLVPMLLSMLLDASVAFMGTIILSLILGAVGGNNFYLALLTFVVGTIALFSVQKIRNRGQMFRAIFYILLGYAAVNFSYGFIHYESFNSMMQNFGYFEVPNAILAPTAVFLLIGIFEKLFDVTTDITLLELSDLNHPLLKRLSVEAPGTFHHSIIVGNLAEAAAKEIGANSLLARVGCYYHDIGKMTLSEYFVENQSNGVSKHETLTPSMSSLILAKHVRAGMELAEDSKLPLAVKKFIPEHHGTCIMSYFYHKAQEAKDPKDLNEDDFRYPGPKPQSKETAIAMLSDAVEAASRTLPSPNLQRISALVENLIEKRFQEGELDECDITLRELNKIKGAFIRVLMGIHHVRIEYPTDDKSRDKSSKITEETKKHTPGPNDENNSNRDTEHKNSSPDKQNIETPGRQSYEGPKKE
ncbi:MAG: HDIG domain-containing protein [bacterium]|nr:MAG: HDIG domain-containing protein [bacterium]